MPELLLPRLKREIEARLEELRPVVAEVEQLEAARRTLLAEREAAQARSTTPVSSEEATRARRAQIRTSILPPLEGIRGERQASRRVGGDDGAGASNGVRRDADSAAVLGVVEERPGVSIAEIVAVTKLDKDVVSATVAKLKREGELADEAGGVKLASRKPLTLSQVAPGRDEGVSDEEWDAARPASRKRVLA
jgi:hypothetical protein